MKLSYLPVHFFCEFEKPAFENNYLPFVLRSVLGKNLRQMSCIAHNKICSECLYKKTCAYSVIFESIVENENNVLPGTNRVSHPFSITQFSKSTGKEKSINKFDFTITLFGKTIDYLPYIFAAFFKAGESGLFKERTKFKIKDVCVCNESILISDMELKNYAPLIFEISESDKKMEAEILVELKTPLRFKIDGKYTKNFSADEFFRAMWRRAKTLFLMCGNETDFPLLPEVECEIVDSNLRWQDFRHYSARQKDVMNLGGVVGSLKLVGSFSDFEMKLLGLNRIANGGKNTNFGLGQMDFWSRLK